MSIEVPSVARAACGLPWRRVDPRVAEEYCDLRERARRSQCRWVLTPTEGLARFCQPTGALTRGAWCFTPTAGAIRSWLAPRWAIGFPSFEAEPAKQSRARGPASSIETVSWSDSPSPHSAPSCSHRWNAAKQARSEPDVYSEVQLSSPLGITIWDDAFLQQLQAAGAVSSVSTGKDGRPVAQVEPFRRQFSPFPHNAHHIIPMSNLWNDVLYAAAELAEPEDATMLSLVISMLMLEPYNINAQPNMITLPTAKRWSVKTGLPLHLEGKSRDHPKYRMMVEKQLRPVRWAYQSLANDVKTRTCPVRPVSDVGADLEQHSKAIYAAILSLARAGKSVRQSLDQVASDIAALVSKQSAR